MKRIFITLMLLFSGLSSPAQKWAVRIGFNNLKSYSGINIKSMHDPNGSTSISGKFFNAWLIGRRSYEVPFLSNFWDISVIRNFNKKHGIMVGYKSMMPWVYSSIHRTFYTNGVPTFIMGASHAQGKFFPSLKLNYVHTLFQRDRVNASAFSVFAGALFCFRGGGGALEDGGWGSGTVFVDSSGNPYPVYIRAKDIGEKRPKYPVPYLNAGIEGSLRLGKRFKMGLELVGYIGPKALYIKEVSGETNDAKFTYEIKLQPYFISGGIFVQYRIE